MENELKLKDFKIKSQNKDNLEVFFIGDGSKVSTGINKGADALYTKLSIDEGRYGVKVIHPDRKPRDQFAYETPKEMFNHLKYIQNKELEIFPKIYDVMHDEENDNVWILMEHISKDNSKDDYDEYDWQC